MAFPGWLRAGHLLLLLLPLAACQPFRAPGPGLVGTMWVVTELHGEAFLQPEERPFYLLLRPDGQLRAYAGCNALGGRYQYAGHGVLRVGPFDSISRFCAPEVMRLERSVVMAMEGASSFVLDDGVLSLGNPLGIVLVRFRAASGAPAGE